MAKKKTFSAKLSSLKRQAKALHSAAVKLGKVGGAVTARKRKAAKRKK